MTFQYVVPNVLKQWLTDTHEIALLDVREAGYFGFGHLLFAVPLPYSRLELDIVRLVPRHSARIVLVDDDEQIAIKAATRLADLGYNNVHVLQGGNPAWKQAGYMLFAGVNVPSKAFGELVEEQTGTPHISAPDLFAMQASKQNLDTLVLEVRFSNHSAIGFYQHQGFEGFTVRKDYYPAPHGTREDANVMKKSWPLTKVSP